MRFVIAVAVFIFAVPFAEAREKQQSLTDEVVALHQEYRGLWRDEARLAHKQAMLAWDVEKLAQMRAALRERQAKYDARRVKYEAAYSAYSAECRVVFPCNPGRCKKQSRALEQRESQLDLEHDRITRSRAAIESGERVAEHEAWKFAAMRQANRRLMADIRQFISFIEKHPSKKGGLTACFPKLRTPPAVLAER